MKLLSLLYFLLALLKLSHSQADRSFNLKLNPGASMFHTNSWLNEYVDKRSSISFDLLYSYKDHSSPFTIKTGLAILDKSQIYRYGKNHLFTSVDRRIGFICIPLLIGVEWDHFYFNLGPTLNYRASVWRNKTVGVPLDFLDEHTRLFLGGEFQIGTIVPINKKLDFLFDANINTILDPGHLGYLEGSVGYWTSMHLGLGLRYNL